MSFLVDTNVISELRKGQRANSGVREWFEDGPEELSLSVLVIGELRRGIQLVAKRDDSAARSLERWFGRIRNDYARHILPVTPEIAEEWGRLGVPDPIPMVDGLMAATALVHGLSLVTRKETDVESTGVTVLNPFSTAN